MLLMPSLSSHVKSFRLPKALSSCRRGSPVGIGSRGTTGVNALRSWIRPELRTAAYARSGRRNFMEPRDCRLFFCMLFASSMMMLEMTPLQRSLTKDVSSALGFHWDASWPATSWRTSVEPNVDLRHCASKTGPLPTSADMAL